VRTLPALRSAVVETSRRVGTQPVLRRALTVDEPALAQTYLPGVAWEWQWDAARVGEVPDWILRAAAGVTVAVVDSGADLRAPDLADKKPATWSVLGRSHKVRDRLGHGTFVSSLAAGSVANGIGISGFGGDARLLVVQALDADGYITDVDEAAAIVYAVKHGAKIVNLSIGGSETSAIEQRAIRWAFRRGALIVAAAGNEHEQGDPVEYPAALLQPVGSHGRGGIGLAVGATSMDGTRAYFSNTGSYLSLAAPGYNVFAAESGDADWPRAELPWQSPGYYGWASGTSFAVPQVAGVAALVWAANPRLTVSQVARVLKRSASGAAWNRELGWGRLDAAAAVELALATKGGALRNVSYLAHEPRPSHSSPSS
jgi:subtilisin family serine protease